MSKIAKSIIIVFFFFLSFLSYAFSYVKDTILISSGTIYSNFEDNLDSLLNLYYVQQSVNADSLRFLLENNIDTIVPEFPDSVYIERLNKIPSIIELPYNNIVRNYIHVYTKKKRKNLEVMLGLAEYYFPIFEEILNFYDLPTELKYMSVIESALNPRAVSRAGATGIWQFMYRTGRMFKLTINSFVDERRDPIKSTHAAAIYLKDLYNIYKDWGLVIAAYNCGPNNVNKAIRRSGGKANYWDIYYYLPRETRGHIPAFIAVTYAMNYYIEHNLIPQQIDLPIVTDTIMIDDELHFKQVAEVLKIPLKQLRDLNPQYRRNIIPAKGKSYSLTIPFKYSGQFIDLKDSIFAYKDSIFFNAENKVINPTNYPRSVYVHEPPSGNMAKLNYTVQSGDNLGYIASWYHVRVSNLRYWNNIRRNLIKTSQKLVVYVPKNKVEQYKKINSMTFAQKQRSIGKSVNIPSTSNTIEDENNSDYIYYKVKYGDTLWDIAKKYPEISDADIMKLNNLKNPNKINPGQTIKIMRKN